jgi:hypothetical protein
MRKAVIQAAERDLCSVSAYMRRALLDRLRADGMVDELPDTAA